MAHEVSKLFIEENLTNDEAKMHECLKLPKIEVVSICIANTLEGNVGTSTTDLPTLLKDLAKYQILNDEESTNSNPIEGVTETTEENTSTPDNNNSNNETATPINSTFTLDNLTPSNLISIDNLDARIDSDLNDTEWKGLKDRELKEDMCLVKDHTQRLFVKIFRMKTVEAWQGKLKEGMVMAKDKICQQTLNFKKTKSLAEATSNGISKEKCLPQGTVHKIAREEAREQCKRDFRRLKISVEKEIAAKLEGNSLSKRNNNTKKFLRNNANASSNSNA